MGTHKNNCIDAVGKACPMPVIMAKKEIDGGNSEFTIVVDNEIAIENLKKLAQKANYVLQHKEKDGHYYVILAKDGVILKEEETVGEDKTKGEGQDWTLFVRSNTLGSGDDTLGESLMKMFFYTLVENKTAPKYIAFVNGGVKLTCENEQVIEHLRKLQDQGSEILVCGTCLNFYGIADKLQVGGVSNMYDILTSMTATPKVVTL